MNAKVNEGDFLYDYFKNSGIAEFTFLTIGRQGFRSAVEILADALVKEGKYVNVGSHLSGKRSMGINVITLRFSHNNNLPTGIYPIYPTGLFVTSESFLSPNILWQDSPGIPRSISSSYNGVLMVCTSKPPESIKYPIDFEGTIATVDAEAIFEKTSAMKPAPFGITALGLFIRAIDDSVGLDTLTQSILSFERLNSKIREINVNTMQKAYEQTRILNNVTIKGRFTREEYSIHQKLTASKISDQLIPTNSELQDVEPHLTWKDKLPFCDQRKCTCFECPPIYYCPEGVVDWKGGTFNIDYNYCKGCGTCTEECIKGAIKMGEVDKILASLKRRRKQSRNSRSSI